MNHKINYYSGSGYKPKKGEVFSYKRQDTSYKLIHDCCELIAELSKHQVPNYKLQTNLKSQITSSKLDSIVAGSWLLNADGCKLNADSCQLPAGPTTCYNLTMNNLHQLWLEHPTGKIPTGTICPHCARFNARNIACLALAFNANQILLVLRKYEPMSQYWALPGGFLDWDETCEQAALREFEEETGLTGTEPRLLGVYSDPGVERDGRQNVALAYIISSTGKLLAGDDAQAVKWFDLEALPDKIAFNHRHVIDEAIKLKLHNPSQLH